jgi:Tfp pilus assembly protein PilE
MAGIELKKVAASTLVEVLISMVIIVVVFGIAMMIFTNVIRFSTSAKTVRAKAVLQDVLEKAEQSQNFVDQSLNAGDFKVEQAAGPYNGISSLVLVHLTASDQNQQVVAELRKVEIKP